MNDALPSTAEIGWGATDAARTAAQAAWTRAQRARDDGDLDAALRWCRRAQRFLPKDPLLRLTVGALLLDRGDAADALAWLDEVAREHDVPAAWAALAACHLALAATELSVAALERALRSSVASAPLAALADRIVDRAGRPGWCGLGPDLRPRFSPACPTVLAVDAAAIEASGPGGAFVGSPLALARLKSTLGFVAAERDGLAGWAWRMADPDQAPVLTVRGPRASLTVIASDPADGIDDLPPLAQPRRFVLTAAELAQLGRPVAVIDAQGRHLLGSPLDPGLERAGPPGFAPRWVDLPGCAPSVARRRRAVDVVVPVYRGVAETLACLDAVFATVPPSTVVHVVDDASPEPALAAALDALAGSGRIRLHSHAENRGFPAAANIGLRAASGRDVVLLNSDTLVPAGWLARLRRAAYAAPEIGTATPLSNDATVVTYPAPDTPGPAPDAAGLARLDAVAQAANAGSVADLPVGVGFCLYVRRDCLDQVGLLREDLFAQGYGEESDFCLRARQFGWRHVAALDVFVAHLGGRSFGRGRLHLRRRNQALLNRHHPGYDALVAAHLDADPLLPARRRMDALRWAEGRLAAGAVLLVTHDEGGGVAELVEQRGAALRAQGVRPVVLRPAAGGCALEGFHNLRFSIPAELPQLAALLRPDRPERMEVHHLLGHDHAVLDLARMLDVPTETWVHDAAWFCPRIALIGRERRYCGEPDPADCADCVADLGSNLREAIAVPDLLARSAAELEASRIVVTPSRDAAQRLRRHFPQLRPQVVAWEDDAALPPLGAQAPDGVTRVCVVGAIGVEKGYDVLLGCVRDASRRRLPLDFVVCGYTEDDARLLDAGPVFITGRYDPAEAIDLIRAQRAQLALIPSIWPETWCFALSRAWQAGLPAVAFDLGAPAERIRATGRGHLLPLGLPPAGVNDALLRLAPRATALQP